MRPMSPRVLLLGITLLAGCDNTSFTDCSIKCTTDTGCPSGLTCGNEGLCRTETTGPSCAMLNEGPEVLNVKAVQNPDLDLLFVIDDSASMADKQNALIDAFPQFVAQLATIDGGMPNIHLGVISSDMGTKGSAVEQPGGPISSCSGSGHAGQLQTGTSSIPDLYAIAMRNGTKNFTGTFADTFRQMAALGAAGCGFEQHLHAMRASFTNPDNVGFLRPTANLAVVILADEDDCSILDPAVMANDMGPLGPLQSFRCFEYGVECMPDAPRVLGDKAMCQPRATSPYIEDIAPFRAALLAQKGGDARRIMLGAIIGNPSPVGVEDRLINGMMQPALKHSCEIALPTGGMLVADPPVRLKALVDSFPGRSSVASVCSADLTAAVTQIAGEVKRLVGDTCLERPIANPAAPDCDVEDVRDAAPSSPIAIRPCASAPAGVDCYELTTDATCTAPPHLRLSVTRATVPTDDTWTRVRCTLP
jgi:hypothetical protein